MSSNRPSSRDAIGSLARAAASAVKVAYPAWIMAYDRDDQRATIQIAIRYRVGDSWRARPAVVNVPVQWLGLTWDLEEGEWGLALICDRAIDGWKQDGDTDSQPQTPRRWDVSDAVFLPGVRPFSDPLDSGAVASGAVVLWDRGTSDIRLGSSSASDPVALDSLVQSELQRLWTAIQTHLHAGVTVGAGVTGVATYPGTPGSVGATKVKAE